MSILQRAITMADVIFPYNEQSEAKEIAYSVYAAMGSAPEETSMKLGSAFKFVQVTAIGSFGVPMVAILAEIKHGPNGGLRYEHWPVRIDGLFTILRALPGKQGIFEEMSSLIISAKRQIDYRPKPPPAKTKNESAENESEKTNL